MKKDFKKLSQDIMAQFEQEEIRERFGVPTCEPGEEFSVMVPMRDGICLNTKVMLPKARAVEQGGEARNGKDAHGEEAYSEGAYGKAMAYPVILIRNPYIALAHSSLYRFYNLYGYGVVYQEVRGKGGSEGDFAAWDNERFDGIDTVRWIQEQPFYNGDLYLAGSSYTAFVHMTMLEDIMDDVQGAVLRVFTPDFRRALYENGVCQLVMITHFIINT